MLKLITEEDSKFNLDNMIRVGVQKMLITALEAEVESYIDSFKDVVDENGHRTVVRNGKSKSRQVTTSAGVVEVEAPRVNDKRYGEKFISKILPPYLRKSAKVESLIPALYLRGISTGKIPDLLSEHLGAGSYGLSPASVSSLLKTWNKEFEQFKRQKLSKKYIYIWADGVNVKVRLGDDKKVCLLVVMGVTESGDKELLAVQSGYRESTESWACLLRDLVSRGFTAPLVAIGDGALGFWNALSDLEEFKDTKSQRCWVHKIANVLNKLPKRVQPEAKSLLHEIMKAPDRESAVKAKRVFDSTLGAKYKDGVECLNKSWIPLTTFFDYPAEHWTSLRTTNPIESSFATVKLRTKSTKGSGSPQAAVTLAFKLLKEAEKKWRKIRGCEEITNLLRGIEYKDGVMVVSQEQSHKGVAG